VKSIQIRNVPDEVHQKLEAMAASAGMSLSEFLVREIRRNVELSAREELNRTLASRTPVISRKSPAEVIREVRGELPTKSK